MEVLVYVNVAVHVQRVALLYIHMILKRYCIGNQGSHDVKHQVTIAARFGVCCCHCAYNRNFSLSENESSYDEREEIHAD